MTTRLILLLAVLLCWAVPAAGQTIKSLGYNTTNGNIVAATNVVWTNAFSFSTNTVAAQVRTNLGLGPTNSVTFNGLTAGYVTFDNVLIGPDLQLEENGNVKWGTFVRFNVSSMQFFQPFSFDNTTNAATTRTNLGLPLPALTNTSNVTAMRALAGSTNTNQPYSGTFDFQDFGDNTVRLTISNGIILNIEFL
jgi:hypothetical protein